ncbi:MAG: hypothetical protein ACRER3_19395, partial [Pseudomonas fluorescens]
NTPYAATPLEHSQNVSQRRTTHQSAAMHAALLVRCQYSRESKSQFRRECLDHLKASLVPEQKASA